MKLYFDPAHPAINENRFQGCDWQYFIRMPVKKYQGTIECLELIECRDTDFLYKTLWGHQDETVSDWHVVVL